MTRTTFFAVFLWMIPVHAMAADVWVDVVNGNDANTGTTPASAWKTLTHASQAAANGDTVHVASGTYSPASGETFPLQFHFQQLVADQGPASTIIDGGGSSSTVLFNMSTFAGPGGPTGLALLQGFTLQNAGAAASMSTGFNSLGALIADCRITAMSSAGLTAVSSGSGGLGGTVHLNLQRVSIDGAPQGVSFGSSFGTSTLTATDCSFRGCSNAGIALSTSETLQVALTRCRIENNAVYGVRGSAVNAGNIHVQLDDCLLAHNFRGLDSIAPLGGHTFVTADFRRCTLADNANTGVTVLGTVQNVGAASFQSTVIHGNGAADTEVSFVTGNTYSQIGGADPQFVDRVNGDYRLRFGSPCIDLGDPATPAGTLDLANVARNIDGNLDANERADIGAFEHQPLRLVTSGHVGTPLRLEMSGQAGGTTTVYFARSMPVSPMSTPFGEFDLNPSTFGTLLHTGVAPFPPVAFQRPIPNNAFLIGHTFSFQALTTSSLAPQGSAYTNVAAVTILP